MIRNYFGRKFFTGFYVPTATRMEETRPKYPKILLNQIPRNYWAVIVENEKNALANKINDVYFASNCLSLRTIQ